MLKFFYCIILIAVLLLPGCEQHAKIKFQVTSITISHVITQMTDLMVHDITNPPLASRFFSYACLAGYEVVSENDNHFQTMHGVLNNYPEIIRPSSISADFYDLSAILAMLNTAQKMQPSGNLLKQYEEHFLDSCMLSGISAQTIDNSKKYALAISEEILAYAKADNYNKISNLSRYTPIDKEGCWYPTPPAFMPAVEPYFKTMRSFTLDSTTQFRPTPPVPFSKNKNSAFYKLMELCYTEGKNISQDHRIIAGFWDCNPFAVEEEGHLLIGLKKISPAAHWLGITGIACKQAKKSFNESMQIYAIVSVALMDAFICCWDEKYRSNRIRPETAIRKYIDPDWKPVLQTPPFPEYLSGHSVISAASAKILTSFLGDHFYYTDSVELKYGLTPRRFSSFTDAAKEAAISRFYGGIHFQDAIDNGLIQGEKVGENVLAKFGNKN